jgi:hypothetical protein
LIALIISIANLLYAKIGKFPLLGIAIQFVLEKILRNEKKILNSSTHKDITFSERSFIIRKLALE